MICKDIGCKAYREYVNGKTGQTKRRCIIHHKQYLLKESDKLPLWCPRAQDPEIKKLIEEQNKRRSQD